MILHIIFPLVLLPGSGNWSILKKVKAWHSFYLIVFFCSISAKVASFSINLNTGQYVTPSWSFELFIVIRHKHQRDGTCSQYKCRDMCCV